MCDANCEVGWILICNTFLPCTDASPMRAATLSSSGVSDAAVAGPPPVPLWWNAMSAACKDNCLCLDFTNIKAAFDSASLSLGNSWLLKTKKKISCLLLHCCEEVLFFSLYFGPVSPHWADWGEGIRNLLPRGLLCLDGWARVWKKFKKFRKTYSAIALSEDWC